MSDAEKIQKAIDLLSDMKSDLSFGDDEIYSSYPQDEHDAITLAISALKKNEKAIDYCKDVKNWIKYSEAMNHETGEVIALYVVRKSPEELTHNILEILEGEQK